MKNRHNPINVLAVSSLAAVLTLAARPASAAVSAAESVPSGSGLPIATSVQLAPQHLNLEWLQGSGLLGDAAGEAAYPFLEMAGQLQEAYPGDKMQLTQSGGRGGLIAHQALAAQGQDRVKVGVYDVRDPDGFHDWNNFGVMEVSRKAAWDLQQELVSGAGDTWSALKSAFDGGPQFRAASPVMAGAADMPEIITWPIIMHRPVVQTGFMVSDRADWPLIDLKSFFIARRAVTEDDFFKVMGRKPSYFDGEGERRAQVTWYDAIEYLNRLSKKESMRRVYAMKDIVRDNDGSIIKAKVAVNDGANGYRLPNVMQLQYAASQRDSKLSSAPLQDMDRGSIEWSGDVHGPYAHIPQGLVEIVWGGSRANSSGVLISPDTARVVPSDHYENVGFRPLRYVVGP